MRWVIKLENDSLLEPSVQRRKGCQREGPRGGRGIAAKVVGVGYMGGW
ncbi:MAG: hypothetical protein ACUVTH_08065 [Thermogutta sp.]